MSAPARGRAIDLFCRVVDNYGDIGVCWRLARQLVAEHGCQVRLIVDDLASFRYLAPAVDPALPRQTLAGVEVRHWPAFEAEAPAPAAVVIEAFACDPPAAYVQAMAQCATKPVWLNLEYLSAEAWVDGVHGRPSPHPRLPLVKYFFCPGFTEQTGGLIRETQVMNAASRQLESQSGTLATDPHPHPGPPLEGEVTGPSPFKGEVRRGMGLAGTPIPLARRTETALTPPTLRLFAFAYPQAPIRAVADAVAQAGYAAQVSTAAPFADQDANWTTLQAVPQPDFDALLAGYDVLIVRGEDSFVRAQFAGKPLLWHIYPTDDAAHLTKLDAWLDRYCLGLGAEAATAYRAASHAFVRGDADAAAYAALAARLPALAAHALRWRDALLRQSDLAYRLMAFVALASGQKVG